MKQRPIIYNVTALFLVIAGGTAVWARGPTPLVVAGYGPGVAGQVIEGPTTPVCRPNIPCTRPFANATVHVQDSATQNPVGTAVTNARGNFLVSVPQGAYIVRVQTGALPSGGFSDGRCHQFYARAHLLRHGHPLSPA